ncbi:MAG: histidine kinase [Proteobacteria bacterium]|nr:histidine kinase [Pseudomonadota bacterium]
MSDPAVPARIADRPPRGRDRRIWIAYAGLCVLCWMLYTIAGTEWLRGSWRLWEAIYESTWNLLPPMLLGTLVLPWVRALQAQRRGLAARLVLHALAAFAFASVWHAIDYGLARALFGPEHAAATFEQQVLWRTAWAVFVYTALVLGFGGALHARRAHAAAVAAVQADAARVRAELAAISDKLNPHFLFNTLNSLILLTRKDAGAAEQALMRYSRMLRYLLDSQRGAADRVALQEELDFVRDYLALESLRLGQRLRVDWQIDDAVLDDMIPPLTLQPLVENSIVHGIAPRVEGGTVRIEARRRWEALVLRVADDGAGCVWPPTAPAENTPRRGGLGLSALRRRFELDYDGQARLDVRSAPGAGFSVDILIPQSS